MDFLKAEIEKKRKLNGNDASTGEDANKKRYVRKGDLEREREEKYHAEQNEKERRKEMERLEKEKQREARRMKDGKQDADGESSREATPLEDMKGATGQDSKDGATATKAEAFNVSNEEAVRRLRSKGQPIRLFAETDRNRRLRLRALELIEERGGGGGQKNDFMRALENTDRGLNLEELAKRSNPVERVRESDSREGSQVRESSVPSDASGPDETSKSDPVMVDLELLKKDASKLYPQIYFSIKRWIKEWEAAMAERPDHIKRSTQGKQAAAVQIQSSEYLKPLLRTLRKRELPLDVLGRVAEICHYGQKREYLKANDSYLQLSIGNAPWPIGVTMVGIHERSGREKIFSSNVAHVLNDEVSRKYIQSLKRLLTFAQSKYPPDDLSQRMG